MICRRNASLCASYLRLTYKAELEESVQQIDQENIKGCNPPPVSIQ